MSLQQNSLIPLLSSSPWTSVQSSLEANNLDGTPLLSRTSTIYQSQCQPDWEDASQINPWVLPKRDSYFNPRPSASNNYLSTHYSRSGSRHTWKWSPMEAITKTSFASRHSLTDSIQSSSANYTSNSDGSSDLLTPPVGKAYTDLPPYKPHTLDSSSLTMSKLRRTRSISFGDRNVRKRRRRAHSNRNRRLREKESKLHSSWWHGSCQIARHGNEYNHIYQRRNNVPLEVSDNSSSSFPTFESSIKSAFTVVQPLIRRWSCSELRGQVQVESQVPCKTAPLIGPTSFMDELVSKYLETRPRSSTRNTSTANNHDIIQIIQKTLTTNKVSSPEVPDLITLRRATVSKQPKRKAKETYGERILSLNLSIPQISGCSNHAKCPSVKE